MTTITAPQLNDKLQRGEPLQVVDVRSPAEYDGGHVPGALNIPLDVVPNRIDDLARRAPVVLVCLGGKRASMACDMLKSSRDDLVVLEGGTNAWREAGLPVVCTAKGGLPLMRQVQLVVGPMAVLGAALALTADARWVYLPLVLGAGLTMAGATGFCPLASLLARMPWNRTR